MAKENRKAKIANIRFARDTRLGGILEEAVVLARGVSGRSPERLREGGDGDIDGSPHRLGGLNRPRPLSRATEGELAAR
jgi:hypothetical protein